jgi:tRNA U34 2-thiouridine synthase MnmA/TrmU
MEVAVLLSGGVDSSVALRMLQEQGHRPTATARPLSAGQGCWEVRLERKDPGIAPGQFTVFYDGQSCLSCARVLS